VTTLPTLLDTLGRPVRDLRISVTDRCNFRCVYCMPKEVFGDDYAFLPRKQLLSFEEIVRVAHVFVDLGVETRLQCRIGTDVTLEQLRRDYAAVFLGMGAQSGRPLPAPGGDAPNVVTATAFLKAFNDGRLRHVGKRVVVIGGGDTSIDVATVARRLGHIEHAKPERLVITTFSLAWNVAPLSVERAVCSHVADLTSGLGSAITCQNATTLPWPSAVTVTPSMPDTVEMALSASKDLPPSRLRE